MNDMAVGSERHDALNLTIPWHGLRRHTIQPMCPIIDGQPSLTKSHLTWPPDAGRYGGGFHCSPVGWGMCLAMYDGAAGRLQLGAEHKGTLSTMHSLALNDSRQGRYDDAELLYKRALAGREKQLGAETRILMTVHT